MKKILFVFLSFFVGASPAFADALIFTPDPVSCVLTDSFSIGNSGGFGGSDSFWLYYPDGSFVGTGRTSSLPFLGNWADNTNVGSADLCQAGDFHYVWTTDIDTTNCGEGKTYTDCLSAPNLADNGVMPLETPAPPPPPYTPDPYGFEGIFQSVGASSTTPPTQNIAIVDILNLDLFMGFVVFYLVALFVMSIFKRK